MLPTGQPGVVLALTGVGWAILLYGSCLAGALLIAAAVIEGVRRWLRRGDKAFTVGDQLAHYRSLYKRGAIGQEEFDRLRAVLGDEVHRAAKPSAPPPAPPPAPPADGVRPE